MQLLILAIIGVLGVSGLVLGASASDMFSFQPTNFITDADKRVYIWNPNQVEITHDMYDELETEQMNSWTLIHHPADIPTLTYNINNSTTVPKKSEHVLPVLVWLDDQILTTQDQVDHLEFELATQIQRTISLEAKLVELQKEIVELKNKPDNPSG